MEKARRNLKTTEEIGRQYIQLPDPDYALMHSRRASHTSYNVESVMPDPAGLIVHAEDIGGTADVNQFIEQIQRSFG
jgi:hypothetical protein